MMFAMQVVNNACRMICVVCGKPCVRMCVLWPTGSCEDSQRTPQHREPTQSIVRRREVSAGPRRDDKRDRGFHLCLKRPAVRTCYGCKRVLAHRYSTPPNDVIVRSYMPRQYTDKNTGVVTQTRTASATYFRLNLNCLRRESPRINARDVFVHDEVLSTLTDGHIETVRAFGLELCPKTDDHV